ncbi:hypothetical protein ILUMI_11592 [Ignelater luminosus]|uniref:DDE Tnp4 domain-containing protein n=1 Tax=Ignelater luminosus TaxID=2038154 RepID=A0A8K0GAC9_IGNLU|nr:hypothetical protein ILUMI_11592 [Ignelater luminosus]
MLCEKRRVVDLMRYVLEIGFQLVLWLSMIENGDSRVSLRGYWIPFDVYVPTRMSVKAEFMLAINLGSYTVSNNMDIVNLILDNEMIEDNNVLVYTAAGRVLELDEPIAHQVANRRHVPRNQDYYEVTIRFYMGDLFTEHFRMSRETIIPLEKKVMFAVWILAKPESFLAAGDRFGLARSTAHVIFREIVGLLVFHERSHGFPGVVGARDGCHIPIKQTVNNAHDYYNRKQFHSIILQGICDHRKVFLNIHVGMPGRVHDARVLRNSPICNSLTNMQDPLLIEHGHLIGDSAYPLMKNLLTPFRDNGHLTAAQNNYNYN